MAADLSFSRFADLLRSKWRTFLVVGLVAVVLATVFSGPQFMAPRYRSSAIVYPVNLGSYSIETRTDQLLQLLESNSIRDSLIARFDLVTHYEVDTTSRGGYFALYNEYDERVDISKTRYESVQIEVVDENPRLARDMVSAMLAQLDLLARRLQREKSQEVLVIARHMMDRERHKLDSVEARLNVLRQESGLLEYESQTQELTKGYMRMLARSGVPQQQKDELLRMLRELEMHGGEFRMLSELADLIRENYAELIIQHDQALNDVSKELTYSNLVQYPEVSDKKVYPVRWLIVLLVTASSLFFTFVLLAWREQRG